MRLYLEPSDNWKDSLKDSQLIEFVKYSKLKNAFAPLCAVSVLVLVAATVMLNTTRLKAKCLNSFSKKKNEK